MKKFIFFCLLLTVLSCKNDDLDELQNSTQETTEESSAAPLDFGTTVQADFMGRIVNDDGFRINNATVVIGDQTVQTDANGVFSIQDAAVFEDFALVKVTKDAYINGSRAVVPRVNGVNSVEITLLRKNIVETVNSGQSSQVTYENSTVFFPGEFEYPDGTPYNGQVDVSVHYLKPNLPETFNSMPGMLLGEDANGNARSMETYGMLAINLFDQAGEELDISENFPATLEFPVDADQAAIAPTEIPLWYFDEEMGYWKEEGSAQRQGNKYVGEVSHFTWWNCDLPLDYVTLCLNLTANEQALSGNYIELIRNETGQTIFYGTLDLNGSECGLIPANESIKLNIYGNSIECQDEIIFQETVGPYSTDTTIDLVIPPDNVDTTLITGTILNCDNTPLLEGFAIIFDENNSFVDGPIPVIDGELSYQFSYCLNLDFQLRVFDSNTTQVSEFIALDLNEDAIALGAVSLCEEQSLIYYGNLTFTSQDEIDTFGAIGYIEINGFLHLQDGDIDNLQALHTLEKINGELYIRDLPELENLEGLNNLNFILTTLGLVSLPNLQNIEALESLIMVNELQLGHLTSLESLEGLENIESLSFNLILVDLPVLDSLLPLQAIQMSNLRNLQLQLLPNIDSISIFSQTQSVRILRISEIDSLTTLDGLENITSAGQVQIIDNDSLISLEGLSGLTTLAHESVDTPGIFIMDNDLISSLNGLENITTAEKVYIGSTANPDTGNLQLTDFCALQNLFMNGDYNEDEVIIVDNAYNPTVQDIIDGNCSL